MLVSISATLILDYQNTLRSHLSAAVCNQETGSIGSGSLVCFTARSDHRPDHDHSDDGSSDVAAQCQLLH